MIDELKNIIKNEDEALNKLLSLLEEQYKYIMGKEVFKLDAMVEKIKLCNKEVAECEVFRRRITNSKSMSDIVMEAKDEELENLYRSIKKTVELVKMQKDTNELLLKQQIGFNTQILNIINPRRENKTYNSYGNLSR